MTEAAWSLTGTPDEFLAALWQGGSQAMSSQASDEVQHLGQYHKQLLAMRTGSGLEGIEVGSDAAGPKFGAVRPPLVLS